MDSSPNQSQNNSDTDHSKKKYKQGSFASQRQKRKWSTEYSADFANFKEEMRQLIASVTSNTDTAIKTIDPKLNDIQQSNKNIEGSMAALIAQNEIYKNKIEKLENRATEDRKLIAILEDRIEDLQKGMRKTCFEVKNVPRKENETRDDLVEMITCLSKNIGCDLNKKDIKDIYRVRVKKEKVKNTPIIVETGSTILKNDFLKVAKAFNVRHNGKICAKHLGLRSAEDTPVFINEHLTAKAARLFFLGRDLVKSKVYKYCWTSYGKVFLRKDENSPIIQLKDEQQIQQLLQKA